MGYKNKSPNLILHKVSISSRNQKTHPNSVSQEPSSITLLQPEKKTDTWENSSSNCFDACEFDKFTYVEDDITVNFLKNFKPDEILNLDYADPRIRSLGMR
ncbi:transmembrane protein, putative [Medicago truncatula]|uniref:Transmembrane protein, putative n=1 Tax=Medicago truncatula TaxID=3880 RepID=A0A072VM99_MEDTR|nr:transmembrane protein, putative [Medicago truncatula]